MFSEGKGTFLRLFVVLSPLKIKNFSHTTSKAAGLRCQTFAKAIEFSSAWPPP